MMNSPRQDGCEAPEIPTQVAFACTPSLAPNCVANVGGYPLTHGSSDYKHFLMGAAS